MTAPSPRPAIPLLLSCLSAILLAGPTLAGDASRPAPAWTSDSEAAAGGTWRLTPPPRERSGHSAIYDPVRNRMILFGGTGYFLTYDEVWELGLSGSPAWTALAPSGPGPTPRGGHTAVYDPLRDRMIVFGGGPYLNDVWALDLSGSPAWIQLAPAGTGPPGRSGHTAVYDPVRDRMLVFGGSASGGFLDDLWALDLAGSLTWVQLSPSGPAPDARTEHTAVYDPVRDRMLVFGGTTSGGNRNDLWALDLAGGAAWTQLVPSGSMPAARHGHTASYDAAGDRMIVLAGSGSSTFNDAWALDLSPGPTWSALAPSGSVPSPRADHSAIYEPAAGRLLVCGGGNGMGNTDVQALALSGAPAWTQVMPPASTPSRRDGIAAVYDPFRHRMMVYGGGGAYVDVWALDLSSAVPTWSALTPSGSPPTGRAYYAAIWDWKRDRMIVFGGNSSTAVRLNDVWELGFSGGGPAWSEILPSGTPPAARCNHSAIFDPARDRMIIFGGVTDSNLLNDVWELSLSGTPAWTRLTPAGSPPAPRSYHSAIYDPTGDRMVVFGGTGRNDVWTLSLSGTPTWAQVFPAGPLPHGRFGQTAVYDAGRARMVVYAGAYPNFPYYDFFADAWQLNLSGSPVWTQLAPSGTVPPGRLNHGAVYDPGYDRMVVFGGESYPVNFINDTWTLTWGAPSVAVADLAIPQVRLAPPRPNPTPGSIRIDFELSERQRLYLDVYDPQGRRVSRIAEGWLDAGRHTRTWHGTDDRGNRLPAGVYLILLDTPGQREIRRSILLH